MAFRGLTKIEWTFLHIYKKFSATIFAVQVRHKGKINLRNPRPLPYTRKRVMEFVKPILPPPSDVCFKMNQIKIMDPYQTIENNPHGVFLVKKLRRNFETHPFIAIFHLNSFTGHEHLHARGHLFDNKIDMTLENLINGNVAKVALGGTKFEPSLRLILPRASLGFSKDPYPDLNKLFKVLKKIHHYLLIGAIYENRLLSRADLEMIANFPDIHAMRAQLSHTLNSPMMAIKSALNSHQSTLSQSLATYANPPSSTPLTEQSEIKNQDGEVNEEKQPV